MTGDVVVAIDPSSKRIAATTMYVDTRKVVVETLDLPEGRAERHNACAAAHAFVNNLLVGLLHAGHMRDHIFFVLESPVMGKGGPGATIPQAQTGGAMMAPAGFHRIPILMADVGTWKKSTVGNGHASKEDITSWLFQHHPSLYKLCLRDNGSEDFDVADSLCINLYGQIVLMRRRKLERLTKPGKPLRIVKPKAVNSAHVPARTRPVRK